MSGRIPAGGPYRAAVGMHDSLSPEAVREARKALASYCSDPLHCGAYTQLTREAARLIAKARIVDLTWDEGYEGADRPLLEAIRRMWVFYSKLIAGFLAAPGEGVLVSATSDFKIPGLSMEKGDVAVVDVATASKLAAAGLAEAEEGNTLKLLAQRPR